MSSSTDDNEITLVPASQVYIVSKRFLTRYRWEKDELRERFELLCRYINKSVEAESTKLSYVTLCLQKENRLDRKKSIY